jgi:hypothetical protein
MTEPIQTTVVGSVTVVSFRERRLHDPGQIDAIREAMHGLIDGGHRNLLFDLGSVESLGTPFLGMLLGLKRRIAASLTPEERVPSAISPLIALAGDDPEPTPPRRSRVFEVYSDRDFAIRVLDEAGPGHGWIALCNAVPEVADCFRVC